MSFSPYLSTSSSNNGSTMSSLASASMVQPLLGFVMYTSWCGCFRMAMVSAMKCTALSTKMRFCGLFCACFASS